MANPLRLPARHTSWPSEPSSEYDIAKSPSDEAIHTVHDHFLMTIVEGLNVCPFARRSRESGAVARELIRGGEYAWRCETSVQRLRHRADDSHVWEIVLLTYPLVGERDAFATPQGFEAFHRDFREALAAQHLDRRYFSVPFHPRQGEHVQRFATPSAFVQMLRRAPDPVIQCVHVETLESVRRQAQHHAQARMKSALQQASAGLPPEVAKMMESAVLTDSELSTDIAQQNFDRYGALTEPSALLAAFAEVVRLRERLYAL